MQDVSGNRTKIESLIEFPVSEKLDLSAFVDTNNNHQCQVAVAAVAKNKQLQLTEDDLWTTSDRTENSCSESHVYDLYAVCNHSGNLLTGHYTGTIIIYTVSEQEKSS